MDESQRLSELIGEVYDAALNPGLWPDTLGRAGHFVGGRGVALFFKNASLKTGGASYSHGIEPRFKQLYFDHYIKLDPCTTGQFFAELEVPTATADIMSYDEFLQTRFYKEWAHPQGFVDFMASILDKSVATIAIFGVHRHESDGIADPESRRRMRLIVPHIRRAVLIGNTIDLKTAESASLADTLDGLSAGMFLVDAAAHIVHANTAGHALLKTGTVLRAVAGKLAARDAESDRQLSQICLDSAHGDVAIGVKGIALPLGGHSDKRYVAHILPLTSGSRRRAGTAYAAVAAVFVHEAGLDRPSPPEVIARAFKLTPTELRVLMAIVEVGGVPEVAVALGVAESTTKTHLAHLFEKTGARRQVDLVKLFAGFSNILVPP